MFLASTARESFVIENINSHYMSFNISRFIFTRKRRIRRKNSPQIFAIENANCVL